MSISSHIQQLRHALLTQSSQAIKCSFRHPTINALRGIFLNQQCPVCDRPADGPSHRTTPVLFCIDCQRQITSTCYPIKGWQLSATDNINIGALGEYRGTLKQAILALKYNNRPEVARSLGVSLAQRWLEQAQQPSTNLYAIPIPLHPNRLAQRGYNQAELIAAAFCRVSGLPMLAHGLIRAHDTLPQHQLGLQERKGNLQSAFTVGKALKRVQLKTKTRPQVLLIDDIYTTGTTAQSAAQTLTTAGTQVVGMLALARAVND